MPGDWERFKHYSSRVRELVIPPLDSDIVSTSSYTVLRNNYPDELILPNLHTLTCSLNCNHEGLPAFIGPLLRSLTWDSTNEKLTLALCDKLRAYRPSLRTIKMYAKFVYKAPPARPAVDKVLAEIICTMWNLQDVAAFRISPPEMQHLMVLLGLRSLCFCISDPIVYDNVILSPRIPHSTFASLQTLQIAASIYTLPSLSYFLTILGPSPSLQQRRGRERCSRSPWRVRGTACPPWRRATGSSSRRRAGQWPQSSRSP